MELKTKDVYRIECTDFLSDDRITSLFSLYQPLLGMQATNLYMTLYAEGRKQKNQETHGRLCALLNLSIDDFERARIHLEEYQLLWVYVEEQDARNHYIYVLHCPLSVEQFLQTKVFYSQYVQLLGQKNAEITLAKLLSDQPNKNNHKDVTRKVTNFKKLEKEAEIVYQTVKPRVQFQNEDTDINFDYEHFFATTTTLVFPAELRTQENLKLIGKLATVYGLSADRMRVLVSKCVKLEPMQFDDKKLKVLCEQTKPDITTAKDPYSLPPVSFLQAKQNGAQVSLGDRKILEDLSVNMHFSVEVINVLIEYVLKKSDNRLVRAFVEMVAGEWARDGVKTKEDALKATKKKTTTRSYRKEAVLPDYMKKEMTKKSLSKEEQKAFEAMLEELEVDHEDH